MIANNENANVGQELRGTSIKFNKQNDINPKK